MKHLLLTTIAAVVLIVFTYKLSSL